MNSSLNADQMRKVEGHPRTILLLGVVMEVFIVVEFGVHAIPLQVVSSAKSTIERE
jgi:hypothetical protein